MLIKKISNSIKHCDLKEDWLIIQKRLKLEGNDTYEVSLIAREIKINLKMNNFISAFKKLTELHSILRDLNIPKLLRLINTNNDALDLVRNKNVHLFIGLTRTGKIFVKMFIFNFELGAFEFKESLPLYIFLVVLKWKVKLLTGNMKLFLKK
jgi:hypothetical protein